MLNRASITVLITAGLGACALGDAPAEASVAVTIDPARVEVALVREAMATDRVTLHGMVRTTDRATLAFTVGGRLVERNVDVGDRVREGQVLARIDGRPYRYARQAAAAMLAELDAQHAQLTRDEARVTALRNDGVSSLQELESTRTGVARLDASREAASQQLRESRRRHSETVLRAPFDGVVRAVMVDQGMVVSPGAPIFAVAGDRGASEVHVDAPERVALWLEPGSPAQVELPVNGEVHQGRVIAVSDAAGTSGLFATRIALDVRTLPGRGALVRIEHRRETTELRVPLAAIVDPSGDAPYLWRVHDGLARRVPIRVLGLREEDTAVLGEGLASGDAVVITGQRPLLEGDAVEVSP